MFYSKSTGGFYDPEINTVIPEDAVEIDRATHTALLAGQADGKRIVSDSDGAPTLADPEPPTQVQVIASYERALDAHFDAVARSYRYDSRFTFALRAGYRGPYFEEASAFALWMDECNVAAFARLQRVLDGQEPTPTVEGFLADLPPFLP